MGSQIITLSSLLLAYALAHSPTHASSTLTIPIAQTQPESLTDRDTMGLNCQKEAPKKSPHPSLQYASHQNLEDKNFALGIFPTHECFIDYLHLLTTNQGYGGAYEPGTLIQRAQRLVEEKGSQLNLSFIHFSYYQVNVDPNIFFGNKLEVYLRRYRRGNQLAEVDDAFIRIFDSSVELTQEEIYRDLERNEQPNYQISIINNDKGDPTFFKFRASFPHPFITNMAIFGDKPYTQDEPQYLQLSAIFSYLLSIAESQIQL